MSTEPITITPDFVWPEPDTRGNRTLANGAVIEQGAVIKPDVVIEQYARIEQGAVIGRGAVIGPYAHIGSDAVIGSGTIIERDARIGPYAVIGPNARWIACVGYADGYYKDLCEVDGVAYIGAGCRWFTLGAALRHWGDHEEDRRATMALMEGAKALATLNNLKWE